MKKLLRLPVLVAALTLSGLSLHAADSDIADGAPAPSADFMPEEVVKIVIDALQTNSAEAQDNGIATVFRFASPNNRAATGPLERFTQMIKRGYPDMLNHAGARYDAMEITGNKALQAVWLLTDSGAEVGYAFQLGQQKKGEFEGMWMTDAVIPLGEGPNSGTRI